MNRSIARLAPWGTALAFAGGVAWDALTLVRIDRAADHALLAAYLVAVSVLVALERRVADDPEAWPRLAPRAAWLTAGAQFFFGSLLSAYVVYFVKASWFGTSFVLLIGLAGLQFANEFRHGTLAGPAWRLGLLWLVHASFFLFFLPIAFGQSDRGALWAAVLIASALTTGTAAAIRRQEAWPALARSVLLSLLLLAADAVHLVPPVPLALLDLGIFHAITPQPAGPGGERDTVWALTWDMPASGVAWSRDDRVFHLRPGDRAHAFTAIFAPAGEHVGIEHIWARWDGLRWTTTDVIPLELHGGATSGWRTWSRKTNLVEGFWRVTVTTVGGRELGRTTFEVVADNGPAPAELTREWR